MTGLHVPLMVQHWECCVRVRSVQLRVPSACVSECRAKQGAAADATARCGTGMALAAAHAARHVVRGHSAAPGCSRLLRPRYHAVFRDTKQSTYLQNNARRSFPSRSCSTCSSWRSRGRADTKSLFGLRRKGTAVFLLCSCRARPAKWGWRAAEAAPRFRRRSSHSSVNRSTCKLQCPFLSSVPIYL